MLCFFFLPFSGNNKKVFKIELDRERKKGRGSVRERERRGREKREREELVENNEIFVRSISQKISMVLISL